MGHDRGNTSPNPEPEKLFDLWSLARQLGCLRTLGLLFEAMPSGFNVSFGDAMASSPRLAGDSRVLRNIESNDGARSPVSQSGRFRLNLRNDHEANHRNAFPR